MCRTLRVSHQGRSPRVSPGPSVAVRSGAGPAGGRGGRVAVGSSRDAPTPSGRPGSIWWTSRWPTRSETRPSAACASGSRAWCRGSGSAPSSTGRPPSSGSAGWWATTRPASSSRWRGAPADLDRFRAVLERDAPPLAVIDRIETAPLEPTGGREFAIVASDAGGEHQTLISPDTATCDACLRELFDPRDRRFRHPFINCTDCGPRFTIIRDVPYDRPLTTMAGFAMCADCAREYSDPRDRRFHAQPVCCPACGPSLRLVDRDRAPIAVRPPGRGRRPAPVRRGAGDQGCGRLPPRRPRAPRSPPWRRCGRASIARTSPSP